VSLVFFTGLEKLEIGKKTIGFSEVTQGGGKDTPRGKKKKKDLQPEYVQFLENLVCERRGGKGIGMIQGFHRSAGEWYCAIKGGDTGHTRGKWERSSNSGSIQSSGERGQRIRIKGRKRAETEKKEHTRYSNWGKRKEDRTDTRYHRYVQGLGRVLG